MAVRNQAATPQVDETALVEHCLTQRRWTLKFPEPLETRFLADGEARRRWMVTAFGVLAMVFFAGLFLPDWLMTPSVLSLSWWVRLVVFPALILTGLVWLHWTRNPRLLERLVLLAGMVAVTLEFVLLTASGHPWALPRIVELNIVVVFVCALARFGPSVLMCVFALVVHGLAAWTLPDVTGVIAQSSLVLLCTTSAFALSATYKLERDERIAFLLDLRERALEAQLERANERLARAATTDPLTGVANRRAFDAFLAESWSRSHEEQRPLALIMLDIDWFKRYNDHHGHQAGDRCLIAVAQAVQSCLRRTGDLVARLGGEEFAVVMVDADHGVAQAAAERIRQAVSALALSHGASPFQHVTISVGVAACVDVRSSEGAAALLAQADEALYRAKSQGRNCVADRATGEAAA